MNLSTLRRAPDVAPAPAPGPSLAGRHPPQTLVRGDGLRLVYDDGRTPAIAGVDIEIARGEFLAIVGPSGCGKSSLLSLIGLLDVPTSGRLFMQGRPYDQVRDPAAFRRRHFGFVFQAFHLVATLTALENVLLPTLPAVGPRAAARAHAEALLSDMGVGRRRDHLPAQMSGGERQRVAIARALVNHPDILIADEPTGALDSATARQVLDLIGSIRERRGTTIVMVTHDAEVSARADRIVPLRDGRIERGWEKQP